MQNRESLDPLNNYFDTKNDSVKFKGHNVRSTLILPFNTKMEGKLVTRVTTDFRSFNGIVGEVYRYALNKEMSKKMGEGEDFKANLKFQIIKNAKRNTNLGEKNDSDLSRKLESIISSLYFKEDDLDKYSYDAMPLLYWNDKYKALRDLSDFFISVFIDKETEQLFKKPHLEKEHLFHVLINKSLPPLEEVKKKKKLINYLVLDQSIVHQFREDIKLISKDSKQFLQQINYLLKYYFYWYVSTIGTKLNQFFKREQVKGYYFTLDSEIFSKNRKANQRGWRHLESRLRNLFSHSICLDLLNHSIFLEETSDYIQIRECFDRLNADSQKVFIEDVRFIREQYMKVVVPKDKKWADFEIELNRKDHYNQTDHKLEREILHLWYAIDFQFHYSDRKKMYKAYSNWIVEFCKPNYLKNRGRGGYCLTLDSENLLFLTTLAVGNKEKIRLKDLWSEFLKRGVLMDDGTKNAIIEFFERINLIEKKSDSGDAQYVKKIL